MTKEEVKKRIADHIASQMADAIVEEISDELDNVKISISSLKKTVDENGQTVLRGNITREKKMPKTEKEKHWADRRYSNLLRSIRSIDNLDTYGDKINEFEEMLVDAGWTLSEEEDCYTTYTRDEGEEITLFDNMFDIVSGIIDTGVYYEDLDLHPCENEKIIAIGPVNCTLYRDEEDES